MASVSSDRSGWAGKSARYGGVGESIEWDAAYEAYAEDRLELAWDLISRIGVGPTAGTLNLYRMVEGELSARQQATRVEITPNLSVESEHHDEALHAAILRGCEEVSRRLAWTDPSPVLVTILRAEADAPWHAARYGYCMDMVPYDKVVLPARVLQDGELLRETFAHEFAHVVVLNRTQNRAPEWVQEGIAMLMEGIGLEEAYDTFFTDEVAWFEPAELNDAFFGERRGESPDPDVWDAYNQAHALVAYLHSLEGDSGLQRLLGGFTNNSFWDELKIRLVARDGADEALREVYRLSEAQIFSRAHDWLQTLFEPA